jgi:hypothetical protein
MSDGHDRDSAKTKVLVDNTAQTVHKNLIKLFQEKPLFKIRWIWELLQNARDVAPAHGVRVSIVRDREHVSFRHDGEPFTNENVAHLIYHGSTKEDPDAIGQFGTGFLTTHLLSKRVRVTGLMDDGQRFSFVLDRTGDTAEALTNSMDTSWEAFKTSLSSPHQKERFTTSYDYPIDESANDLVDMGIRSLLQNAAFLLAFNHRIASVHIVEQGKSYELQKMPDLAYEEGKIVIEAIEERQEGEMPAMRFVGVLRESEVVVAVELAAIGAERRVLPSADCPRIFKAFPLTATVQFCLPVIINSEKLQPRENRDTVFLGESSDGKLQNRSILELACGLAAELAVVAASLGWENAAQLACLGPLQPSDWLDAEWFRPVIEKQFIEKLRASPILTTVANTKSAPAAAWVPLSSDGVSSEELWDLALFIADSDSHMPRRNETNAWAAILENWAPYLGKAPNEMNESLTLIKVCEKISACKDLVGLQGLLRPDTDPIHFLNAMYAIVSKASATDLLRRYDLIPNQHGILAKITNLRRDGGIDDSLKKIAEQLGVPARVDIVDKQIRCDAVDNLKAKEQAEVVLATLQKARERAQAKTLDQSYPSANVALFAWLVRSEQLDHLDGFPVLTRATTKEDPAILKLSYASDDQPLLPLPQWPEAMRIVIDLFPKARILADEYHEADSSPQFWLSVANAQYVRGSPLYMTRQKHIPFIPDEPIPEKDLKQKHHTKNPVEVRTIAFFDKEGTGLDAARRSKQRASNLLMFLGNYVLYQNPDSLDQIEAECECGLKHHYYKAAWLVPLSERRWVPLGDSKQSAATAEAIAQLFEKRENDLRALTSGEGRKLLEALGISMADLSLRAVAADEESRISLIASLADIFHAANDDPDRVRLLADDLRESPELLNVLRDHRDRREKIRRNQSIGAAVEELLKRLLESHGLRVTRTGIGSDFEVESDFVEGDTEILFTVNGRDRSYLVEIKSARTDRARMTVTQARTAVAERCRFVLCLVKLDGISEPTALEVEAGCRFMFDIANRIEPVWNDYARVEGAKAEASERHGDVELEMENADTRFAVSMKLWGTALVVEEAVARFQEAHAASTGERA